MTGGRRQMSEVIHDPGPCQAFSGQPEMCASQLPSRYYYTGIPFADEKSLSECNARYPIHPEGVGRSCDTPVPQVVCIYEGYSNQGPFQYIFDDSCSIAVFFDKGTCLLCMKIVVRFCQFEGMYRLLQAAETEQTPGIRQK